MRWGNLQAKFLQELSTSRETNQPSSWPQFDELLFIKDGIVYVSKGLVWEKHCYNINIVCYFFPRSPFMDGKHDLNNPSDPPVPAVSVVLSDNPLDVVIGGTSTSSGRPVVAKRRLSSLEEDPDLELRIVKVLKRVQDEQGDRLNKEDEYFGRLITEKLKSFPKKLRNDAKAHIFRYLFDLDNGVVEIE